MNRRFRCYCHLVQYPAMLLIDFKLFNNDNLGSKCNTVRMRCLKLQLSPFSHKYSTRTFRVFENPINMTTFERGDANL